VQQPQLGQHKLPTPQLNKFLSKQQLITNLWRVTTVLMWLTFKYFLSFFLGIIFFACLNFERISHAWDKLIEIKNNSSSQTFGE